MDVSSLSSKDVLEAVGDAQVFSSLWNHKAWKRVKEHPN